MDQNQTIDILIEALSFYIEDDNSGVVVESQDHKIVVCKINQEVSIVPLSEIVENPDEFESGQWIKLNIEFDE
jgi:hypothetical protein